MESPYRIIGVQTIQKCLFLLQLNSVNKPMAIGGGASAQSVSRPVLKPPGVARSISQPINEKYVDKEKLELFRSWIESYQKWKAGYKNEDQEEEELLCSASCSPIKSIIAFLCSQVNVAEIQRCLRAADKRCAVRVKGLSMLHGLTTVVQRSCFQKYAMGILNENFKEDCFSNVLYANKGLKHLLALECVGLLAQQIACFNAKFVALEQIKLEQFMLQISKVRTVGAV